MICRISRCLLAALVAAAPVAPSHAVDKKGKPPAKEPAKPRTPDSPQAPAVPKSESPATLGLADDGKIGRLPGMTAGLSDLAAQAFARRDWDKARNYYLE